MRYLVILLLVALAVTAAVAAPPTYPVYRAAGPVTVDGVVKGDPAWAGIPSMTGFSVLGAGYSHSKQTVAQVCWDDEALYLAVTCEEPDAAQLKPTIRDGGDTWAEDSLEIFLHPLPLPQVYQFGITAGGARGGFEGNPDPTKFQAAAKIGEKQYVIEARFPYSLLKGTPQAGGTWRGNICRNIFTTTSGGDKFTSWAPLQSRFLEPENFAFLKFDAGTPSVAEAAAMTEELNAPYRAVLATQIAEAAALGVDYVDTLKQASEDEKFGERARDLLREWRQIERLNREAQQASILDMRVALMRLQVLNVQSYEVKYQYLIYRLLSQN